VPDGFIVLLKFKEEAMSSNMLRTLVLVSPLPSFILTLTLFRMTNGGTNLFVVSVKGPLRGEK
jgi:hypothetical protein